MKKGGRDTVGWALPTSLKSGISEQDAQCSEQDAQCSEQDARTTARISPLSPLLTLRFKCRTAYDE
ncbi:MAG: hypothetical protein RIB93_09280 [Coleofasciculus sp. D1-CHI-01]